MSILKLLLDKIGGRNAVPRPRQSPAGQARLARIVAAEPPPLRPSVELTIEALECECAEPLYDISAYVSPPASGCRHG